MVTELRLLDSLSDFLAGAAELDPAPARVGAAEPATAGELPAVVMSLDALQRVGPGLGERSERVTGALPQEIRVDLAAPFLPSDRSLRLVSDDRRTLILYHGGLVRADGSPGPLGPADLSVRVDGAARTVVAGPPADGEVRAEPEVGRLTFGAALPAAGEVEVRYFLGEWERSMVRLRGVLRLAVLDRTDSVAAALSAAVVEAVLGPAASGGVPGLRSVRLASLGSIGAPDAARLDARTREAAFTFEFEDLIERPDGGGVIREIPVLTRLPMLAADGATVEERSTLRGD